MKILIFINSLGGGGAERVTINLSKSWADCGHDVSIVTLNPMEDDFYDVDDRVTRISLGVANDDAGIFGAACASIRRVLSLRRVINSQRPDVVIGTMTRASVVSILASIGFGCRVVVTEHNHPPMLSPGKLWSLLRYLTYRYADEVIALTGESARWLERHCRCKKVNVIPNAVVWPISIASPVVNPEMYCEYERRILLAVGRLVPQKGFDYLIEAFSKIAQKYPTWDLMIIGEGEGRPFLQKKIERHDLCNRVTLPGRVGNVGEWYARADIYVLSSRFEGFPMTLIEAMASGLAVVSYDCETGPRDIIDAGENGVLVRPAGNVDELAKALAGLMNNAAQRVKMAEQAKSVREKFSSEAIGTLWNDSFVRMGLRSKI